MSLSLKDKNILIVDDEQTIITIVKEVLKQLGARPFTRHDHA